MARRTVIVDTRLEIISAGLRLFLKNGFETTSASQVAREVGISLGNLTYHFPTKEHLLAVLTREFCDYHMIVLESEVDEGKTSLLAYCLEIAALMAVCEEYPTAKELYISMYTHPMSLKIIRENETRKTREIFSPYCPEWRESDFVCAENIVSGIEYGSIMSENFEGIGLSERMTRSVNAILKIYNIPEELRRQKIEKILAMDYHKVGKSFVAGLEKYINKVNDKALRQAAEEKELADEQLP